MIIIPIKWLFHWEYTLFSDKPTWFWGNFDGESDSPPPVPTSSLGPLTSHPWKPSASGWWWGCVDNPTPPGPPVAGGPFLGDKLGLPSQFHGFFGVKIRGGVHYQSWKLGEQQVKNEEMRGNEMEPTIWYSRVKWRIEPKICRGIYDH